MWALIYICVSGIYFVPVFEILISCCGVSKNPINVYVHIWQT
jgi:hypothetical protein